jgi:RNA polymerase sigma-70 factor (ECF subfamily)
LAVDIALVERARRGDPAAFEVIVRQSADRLYAIACRILRDPDAADDAMQEALVGAWKDMGMLRDPERLEAWLNRLLIRACYRAARRERGHAEIVRQIRPESPTGDDDYLSVARRDELELPYARLSPEHRAVVTLRYFVGLTVPEIAETLGIPAGTAASRLHYALGQLRADLEAGDRRPVSMGHPA